jgi:filamentous hemagglutinin
VIDKVLEGFGGTHDTLNSGYWYDDNGNIRTGMTKPEKYIGAAISAVNLIPSAPFALATLLPPEVWNTIGAVLAAGK